MEYLENPDNIRNICILAHVDHGKTTIADSLIASNGIISHRMAGKLRYMDNQPEEQERGITMKTSSIALKYSSRKESTDADEIKYLVNLIDTPGHVDFCGEVSAAVRLCDGALIVLDVVEGVSPQTIAALEQAWKEGIEPILVFNKLDRLIVEQKLDENAAYIRLGQLLEQINAIVATLLTTEIFQSTVSIPQEENQNTNQDTGKNVYDWASAIDEVDDDKYYFRPDKNNVIFTCAIDNWAFTIQTFAKFLAEKHKINLSALQKTLWGDYYIDIKQKRILKGAQAKGKKNLFVGMVLESIWKVYKTILNRDVDKINKVCQVLGVDISSRDLNHADCKHQIKLIMSKWLPLAQQVLECVSKLVPSPRNLSDKRIDRFLCSNLRKFEQLPQKTKDLKISFKECSGDSPNKIAFISKMLPFERKNLPQFKTTIISAPPRINGHDSETKKVITVEPPEAEEGSENGIVFIAFARIFSGRIKRGDELFVLGPRHDPYSFVTGINSEEEHMKSNENITSTSIQDIFLLMGRDLVPVTYADAGNIVGIQGLEDNLTRTGTLSNTVYCPPFGDWHSSIVPILRVAIEPVDPQEMPELVNGLKLLNQADPCIEVKLQETGEHVIIATGELHLQHCIRDLYEKYTNNIELNVSQPIVPSRETIVLPPKVDMVNEAIGDRNTEMKFSKSHYSKKPFEIFTPNKKCMMKMKASPLPNEVLAFLKENDTVLKTIQRIVTSKQYLSDQYDDQIGEKIRKFSSGLDDAFSLARKESNQWKHLYQENPSYKILSFGPKHSGHNILMSNVINHGNIWSQLESRIDVHVKSIESNNDISKFVDSFISGFQLATQSGPLCEEPMYGVCFTIHDWKYEDHDNEIETLESTNDTRKDMLDPISGQIISTVKEACRRSFQDQPQRIMAPMFSCDIQVTSDMLGKMYAVLGRRHGKVLHSDLREGSQIFEIKASIPVIESIDFVGEIRKQTSGLANPQLVFSHYEIIDVDPFWTPSTEEEYALFGEKADFENQAKKYINLVRRRKGLQVHEKIVEHGEKQRTNKRNK